MHLARLTTKGQMTIPKRVREAAHLSEGDLVALEVKGDVVSFRKVAPTADPYLRGLAETLTEWAGPEDDEAFSDL